MEPFIGMVQMFGFNFAPRSWAMCDGQLLAISSNTALFSLIGTTFGGDGRTTFGLPDLRGRAAVGVGTGPGLNHVAWGERMGAETITLLTFELPSHKHHVPISVSDEHNTPSGHLFDHNNGSGSSNEANLTNTFGENTIQNTGGGQSHENRSPFLTVTWCIALQGIFPSRS